MFSRFALSFALIVFLSLSVLAQSYWEGPVEYPELSKRIIDLRGQDQKLRGKFNALLINGKRGTKKFEAVSEELMAADRRNTAMMRRLIEDIGWPTYAKVGSLAGNTSWLMVQHADRWPLFQEACLPLLKAAVDEGQAAPADYANLFDRIRVARGEKQRYGTQIGTDDVTGRRFFYPIEDEHLVVERRAGIDYLASMLEIAKKNGFTYTVPPEQEAGMRAEAIEARYQKNISVARAAMARGSYKEAADAFVTASYAFGWVTTEDFVNAARALSRSKHKKAGLGTYYLSKAVMRGYEGMTQLDEDPDFAYLKTLPDGGWPELMATVEGYVSMIEK